MENETIENLEEELKRIKEKIEKKKQETSDTSIETNEKIVYEALKAHVKENPHESLDEKYKLTQEEIKTRVSNLEPEEDDKKIVELFNIAMTHGVINAVHICENLNNPHILDDFHRRLAHYFNFETTNHKKENFKTFYIIIGVLAVVIIALILFMTANY